MLPRSRPSLWSAVTAPLLLFLLMVAAGYNTAGYAERARPSDAGPLAASADRSAHDPASRRAKKRATLEADGFHDSGEHIYLRLNGRAPSRGSRKVVLHGRSMEDGALRRWARVSTNGTSKNGRFTVFSQWTQDAEYRVVLPKWNGKRRVTSRPIEVPFRPGGPIAGGLEAVPGGALAYEATMSDDGSVVAYTVAREGRRSIVRDLFLYDTGSGETVRLRPPVDGDVDRYGFESMRLSADGRWLAFSVMVPTSEPGQYNEGGVLLHDLEEGEYVQVQSPDVDLESLVPSDMSADGMTLVGSVWLGRPDGTSLVAVDVLTGEVEVVSRRMDGRPAFAYDASTSDDGRLVYFTTYESGLVPQDEEEGEDAFRYDRETGETSLVSVDAQGRALRNGGGIAAISGDGRYVALHDGADVWTARLYEQTERRSTPIMLEQDGRVQGFSVPRALSSDGARGVFAECGGAEGQVYLGDMTGGVATRLTTDDKGYPGNGRSGPIAMSGDGRTVLLSSDATNLADGASPTGLFLWRERVED